ncbi:MAG TPA: acyltransferase [Firmicutes bacterium]|nr:acyltransferase [Bacillota bacterium]
MPKRIIEMDILRGLAILGVITGHVAAETLYVKTTFLGIFFNQVIRFAVPVYIFLSGLGLGLSKRPYSGYIDFVGQRLRKIIPLYSLWTAIYLFPLPFGGPILSLKTYCKAVFTGNASYQLYFVPLIIQFYLLFPLLRRYFQASSGLVLSFFITLALQASHVYLPKSLLADQRFFLNWLFFFVLGLWCAPRLATWQRELQSRRPVIFTTFLLCLTGMLLEAKTNLAAGKGLVYSLSNIRPSVMLYSLAFGALVFTCQSWPKGFISFFRFLSGISYELFLVHVFVLVEFNALFIHIGISKATLTYGFLAFFAVLVFSTGIVLVQRYLLNNIFQLIFLKL